ncbi:hypothetical protein V501_10004 [Pseudogymnoascus sp. VKM F-4519 (FW-2642)]|nr:hypothetical protein V501_10004 [Pseudogymnoascus sp. VKM F-4519 (FW-2642)]
MVMLRNSKNNRGIIANQVAKLIPIINNPQHNTVDVAMLLIIHGLRTGVFEQGTIADILKAARLGDGTVKYHTAKTRAEGVTTATSYNNRKSSDNNGVTTAIVASRTLPIDFYLIYLMESLRLLVLAGYHNRLKYMASNTSVNNKKSEVTASDSNDRMSCVNSGILRHIKPPLAHCSVSASPAHSQTGHWVTGRLNVDEEAEFDDTCS